jgi:pimeloyl-ACP methyl ester carboxylesterase
MPETIINHENIVYEDLGSGVPIIFIHPPGMGRKVFYKQKPLSQHFRLIIPDLVGQGDSSYNHKSEISIKRFAEDIIGLMDELSLPSSVVFGYSAGGTIAQYLCIQYPSRVKALILSGGYPIVDNFTLKNEHRLGMLAVEKSKKFLSSILAFSHTKDKTYRGILKKHMYKSNTVVWSKFYSESLHFNCKEAIKGMTLPVLLMNGSKSDSINTYIKFYKRNLPNQQTHVIKGETHQLPTKQPHQVNSIITNFLLNSDS